MKFVIYRDNKVLHIFDKEPLKVSNGLSVARCENVPTLKVCEYHEVFNIQERTETYTVKEPKEVIKKDELGNEYTDTEYNEVVKTRNYKTCNLLVKQDAKAIKLKRIAELKRKLKAYDYIGTKIATGRATKEEYATQIAEMIAWANEINELER